MLRHSLVRDGHWLFRHRSVLPVLFVPAIAAVMLTDFANLSGSADAQFLWTLGCFAVSLLGVAVRMAVVGVTPANTSGRNTRSQKADQLNTAGAYSVCRNPLYVGNYLIWLGIVAVPHHAWLIATFTLTFWLYYERIIAAEEDYLEDKFGDAYRRFAASTPCVLPRLTGWAAAPLKFSPRNCLRREYTAILGICGGFALMNIGSHSVIDHQLMVDPFWVVVAAAGLIQFFVLRTLKKQTAMLFVPGR